MRVYSDFAQLICALMIGAVILSGCSPKNTGDSQNSASALTVRPTKPLRLSWPHQLTANGALVAWQEAIISAETGSLRIASIDADVGTWARKGQTLATLASDSLLADQAKLSAQVAEAKANFDKAASDVERTKQVASSGALSAQQIESYRVTQRTAQALLDSAKAQLRSVEIQLGQTNVRAVDDGMVSSRSALLGKVVNAGDELFRLMRQGRVEWQAELDAQQLAQVHAGQIAHVTLPGGQVVNGKVRLVAPTLSSSTSRGIVYVELPLKSPAQAGMYGSGTIETGNLDVLTLPDTAVVLRDGKSYVLVIQTGNRVKQQNVLTGQRKSGRIEVQGLAANSEVVETGGAFLADGLTVNVQRSGR